MTWKDAKASAGPEPSHEDIYESRRLKSIGEEMLPVIRSSAEKWRNGLGVSAGVTALVGVFLSAQNTITSAVETRVLAGSLTLAILGGVASIVLALRASAGWPRKLDLVSLQEYRTWESDEVNRAAANLKWSVRVAVVALLLAGATAVMSVAWPLANPGVQVTRVDGSVLCGSSVTLREGELRLVRDGNTIPIKDTHVLSVDSVRSCKG